MRICFVTEQYSSEQNLGGIGVHYGILANGLAQRGHSVIIITKSVNITKSESRKYGQGEIQIFAYESIFKMYPKWDILLGNRINFIRKIKDLINHKSLDIIEFPDWRAEAYLFHKLGLHNKLSSTIRLHSPLKIYKIYNPILKYFPYPIIESMESYCFSKAFSLNCPSYSTEIDFHKIYKTNQESEVLFAPIDNYFLDVSNQPLTNEHSETKIILFVGRLSHLKNPTVLAKSLRSIFNQLPNIKAYFVGRDRGGTTLFRDIIIETVGQSNANKLEFYPQQPRKKLRDIYRKSTICVVPSRYETFGNVCVEAMGQGIPVVASNAGALKEHIEDGVNGMLFKDNDSSDLARKILFILNNPTILTKIAIAGRRYVINNYSEDKIIPNFENYYLNIIEKFNITKTKNEKNFF